MYGVRYVRYWYVAVTNPYLGSLLDNSRYFFRYVKKPRNVGQIWAQPNLDITPYFAYGTVRNGTVRYSNVLRILCPIRACPYVRKAYSRVNRIV